MNYELVCMDCGKEHISHNPHADIYCDKCNGRRPKEHSSLSKILNEHKEKVLWKGTSPTSMAYTVMENINKQQGSFVSGIDRAIEKGSKVFDDDFMPTGNLVTKKDGLPVYYFNGTHYQSFILFAMALKKFGYMEKTIQATAREYGFKSSENMETRIKEMYKK